MTYTDGQGTAESVSVTSKVVANTNGDPTGDVRIIGEARQGETLTADVSNVNDPDGISSFSYFWSVDGDINTQVQGDETFTLTQAHVGKTISVSVTFIDDEGNTSPSGAFNATSTAVENVNDVPTGSADAVLPDGTEDTAYTVSISI